MAYTDNRGVKTYLGISGTGDDALLTTLVTHAQAAIDSYCRRTFEAAADSTRYIDALGDHIQGYTLHLDDIGELASITTVTNGDSVEVTSAQYVTIERNVTPYRAIRIVGSAGKTWTFTDDWEGAISIAGKWAYSTSAPADVVQACDRLASFYYRQKDSPMHDVEAVEAGVVMRPVGLPLDVRMLLRPYRRY